MKLSRSDLRSMLQPSTASSKGTAAKSTKATKATTTSADPTEPAVWDDVDRFEREQNSTAPRSNNHDSSNTWQDAGCLKSPDKQPKLATLSTKRAGFSSSAVFFGAEFAVKVNHVDPLNAGRRDFKLAWVADGEHGGVDVESVLLRRNITAKTRFELQGPGISAKAADGGLPLKTRFFGIGVTGEIGEAMPHDTTPPRVEVKVEVKLTDKSLGSLAALAGCTQELTNLTAELAGSELGKALGTALVGAIPVVSGAVAVVSAKRAWQALKDPEGTPTTKSLAVARALADATTVVLPLVGTLINIGLVFTAVGLAFNEQRLAADDARNAATPSTGPPGFGPAMGTT